MSRRPFMNYWEDYSRSHEDLVKEFLPEEDLVIKGKYCIFDKSLKLSAKSNFINTDSGVKNTSDFKLAHKLTNKSNYNLISKSSGETILQGNFHLAKNEENDISFSLYVDSQLKIRDATTDWVNKVQLRCEANNVLFSLGFEDWNLLKQSFPTTISSWGLVGTHYKGWDCYGGLNASYGITQKMLNYTKLLFAFKNEDWKVMLEKKLEKECAQNATDQGLEAASNESCDNIFTSKLIVEHNFSDSLKLLGNLSYVYQKKEVDNNLEAIYNIDPLTLAKLRLRSKDHSISLGINRCFNNFINFSFVSKVNLNAQKFEHPESHPNSPWFKYKFSAMTEFFN